MRAYIFQSEKDADVVGFTPQRDGGNLPAEFGPWQALGGGQAIQTGEHLAGVNGGGDAVQVGIQRDGFFLARTEVRITHHTSPRSLQ